MLILALDTAGATASVAMHDGRSLVATAAASRPMAHAETLGPAISTALADAGAAIGDLTDIAVGVGPGPFTGLRVGIMTAITLADTTTACGPIKPHGICSLDVLAAEVHHGHEFLVATDARRSEVYWARYDAERRRLEGPAVARPAELALAHPGLPVYGSGAAMYADTVNAAPGPDNPQAGVLAAAVADGTLSGGELRPLYLRRPDAKPLPGM